MFKDEEFHVLKNYQSYSKGIFPFIVQIGVGGTGGLLVQHIAQLLSTSGTRAAYVIADPDVIEEKNLKNQLFLPEEVGLKKADVLASRYSAAYNLPIGTFTDSYIEDIKTLRNLFNKDYMALRGPNEVGSYLFLPIIIGAVDNNYTRQVIHELFSLLDPCVYIDAGNESATVPHDWLTRDKSQWTEYEKDVYKASGWSGQVVTGFNFGKYKQEPVGEAFPDVLLDTDEIKPSEVSCSDLAASMPQRLIVNKFSALTVTNVLTELIAEFTISNHVTFFHSKKGYMRATPLRVNETNIKSCKTAI